MAETFIRLMPLGAGQDVGRSCIMVSIAGKNIMYLYIFSVHFNEMCCFSPSCVDYYTSLRF